MPNLFRKDLSRGWLPSADAVNCPKNALLRMDNCVLDEQGAVAVRRGSYKITSGGALGGAVKNFYTAVLNGVKYRMTAAGTAVYSNQTSIATGFNGTGVSFGDYLGQIFFAWSTIKKKWDGSTLRTWGIAKPSNAPTMANVNPYGIDIGSWSFFDTAKITTDEGTDDYDSAPDGIDTAYFLIPSGSSNRGTATFTYSSPVNADLFGDGGTGLPEDQFKIWLDVFDPELLKSITIQMDCNGGNFDKDFFTYTIPGRSQLPANAPFPSGNPPAGQYFDPSILPDSVKQQQQTASLPRVVAGAPILKGTKGGVAGVASYLWQQVSIQRGLFTRVGSTPNKGWATSYAMRIIVEGSTEVGLWSSYIYGGAKSPLNGTYRWRYALVRDDGVYQAISPLSDISATYQSINNAVNVTCNPGSGDAQANRIWLYRMGGTLDRFLRVKDVSYGGSGSLAIADTLGDRDALIQNIEAPTDTLGPPSDIVDIEGPYYDRLFCLTQTLLWPSQRRMPENYSAGQGILVADQGEVALWIKRAYGGLYIGTTKDIYRIDGDGSEYPDGTINFRKTPLNIGNPPVGSNCVVAEGNFLVYMSADGWRALAGSDSIRIAGDIDLLFKGMARHGVSALNISDFSNTGCRYWGAVAHGQMWVMMPEGSNTQSTPTIYRYDFQKQRWYRHVYPWNVQAIYRETDGSIIVGTTAGHIYLLEFGNSDDSVGIPILLDFPIDDGDMPMKMKDSWNFQTRLVTTGENCLVKFYTEGKDPNTQSADLELTFQRSTEGVSFSKIENLISFMQVQLRFSGTFTSVFRLMEFLLEFRERPQLEYYNESKPSSRSVQRRRFGGFNLMIHTFGQNCTITPVLDDVDQTPFTVNTSDVLSSPIVMSSVIGRDLWAKISLTTGFELYLIEPVVLEELPIQTKGQVPYSNAGYSCDKVLSGIHFRVNTLGASRIFTPILDGVAQAPFTFQTGALEPDDYIYNFLVPTTAEQIAWSVDGAVELYGWDPVVMYKIPCPRKVWDTGPVDMGTQDLSWVRLVRVKCRTFTALTVQAYFDGVPFTPYTVNANPGNITVYDVPIGREYKGKQPRIVVTAGGQEFNPYWVEFWFRPTGTLIDRKPYRCHANAGEDPKIGRLPAS